VDDSFEHGVDRARHNDPAAVGKMDFDRSVVV
jgi:hypothetical protein